MTMQASAALCLAAHSFDYFHTSLNCIIGQYAEDDETALDISERRKILLKTNIILF